MLSVIRRHRFGTLRTRTTTTTPRTGWLKINNGAIGQYLYDCEGRRVKKIDNGGTTIFVYDVTGRLVAEYHSDPLPPVQGGGGTSYLTTDHLGSTRVVTNSTGGVKARYDYLPFGEEIGSTIGRGNVAGYGGADSTKQKFTQKERDSESGLDYFIARYYSSAQGRFTSPDEFNGGPLEVGGGEDKEKQPLPYSDIAYPQSLNKYHYCLNNPLHYVDPDGHDWRIAEEKDKDGKLVRRYVWDRNYTWKKGDKDGAPAYFRYIDTQGRVIQLAVASNTSGKVEIEVEVNAAGEATSARTVEGHLLPRQAAERTARRWRFAPDAAR
jgi:RHS repeat-associated protein